MRKQLYKLIKYLYSSVDIINDDTFEYENVTTERVGGLDWSLLFTWSYNMEGRRYCRA